MLHSLSPNLVILNLQSVLLDNRCLSALCMLTRLEEVLVLDATSEATPVTLDFLLDMSARHTLRRLRLCGSLKIIPSSKSSINCDPIIFSALKHIELDCDLAMAAVTSLLYHITFPVLEEFRIGLYSLVDRSDLQQHWYQFFNTIGNATTKHLKELAFTSETEDPSLELHLFGLLKLGSFSLTLFTVHGPFLSLGHRDMEAIIGAWPLLTTLSLPQHHEPLPKIDFSVLIAIARGLPHLKDLELSIDANVLPELSDIPLLSHGLQSFMARKTLIGDARLFAQSLDRLFPNMKIWYFGEGEEVASLLNMLHRVRRDDAMRLTRGHPEGSSTK